MGICMYSNTYNFLLYLFLLANDICSTIDNNYRRPDIDYVIALYKM